MPLHTTSTNNRFHLRCPYEPGSYTHHTWHASSFLAFVTALHSLARAILLGGRCPRYEALLWSKNSVRTFHKPGLAGSVRAWETEPEYTVFRTGSGRKNPESHDQCRPFRTPFGLIEGPLLLLRGAEPSRRDARRKTGREGHLNSGIFSSAARSAVSPLRPNIARRRPGGRKAGGKRHGNFFFPLPVARQPLSTNPPLKQQAFAKCAR